MSQTVRWRSLPIVDDYPRSLLFVAVVLAGCVGAYFVLLGAGVLLAVGLFGVTLGNYYLPTRYELDEHAVRVRFMGRLQEIPWGRVRRVDEHKAGVFLSPFPEPSRLDSFRGTFLRFSGNAEEVLTFVREHTKPAE